MAIKVKFLTTGTQEALEAWVEDNLSINDQILFKRAADRIDAIKQTLEAQGVFSKDVDGNWIWSSEDAMLEHESSLKDPEFIKYVDMFASATGAKITVEKILL